MTEDDLIREEQKELDKVIEAMDIAVVEKKKALSYYALQRIKAKKSNVAEAYGSLVYANHEWNKIDVDIRNLYRGKDELYNNRIVLTTTDEYGTTIENLRIGLHTYAYGSDVFIINWKMPVCRHYLLDNSSEEYDGEVTKEGRTFKTHYKLRLKRSLKISFDKVEAVTHFFPITEETEKVLADGFLEELLSRRADRQFRNIVFSIQKKQGEIIQAQFKQNMIVQGCAGSGKSMIMLHRLPIVLYDNPNSVDRNNLYIITPSLAYIQMANKMRYELEIADLKMGTISQYYDHVLEKYKCKPNEYGVVKRNINLSTPAQKYVYSKDCVNNMRMQIERIIKAGNVDLLTGWRILNKTDPFKEAKTSNPADTIQKIIIRIQTLIRENDNVLNTYHSHISQLLKELRIFANMLEGRESEVERYLNRNLTEARQVIENCEKDIAGIQDIEKQKVMYQNRVNSIAAAKARIDDLCDTLEIIKLDKDYFSALKSKAKEIDRFLSQLSYVNSDRYKMTVAEMYKAIGNIEHICDICAATLKEVNAIGDSYREYLESLATASNRVHVLLANLHGCRVQYLPPKYLQSLIEGLEYYKNAAKSTVNDVYLSQLTDIGVELSEKSKLYVPECAIYLYLQLMFLFNGAPNSERESLITIDEAQNIAAEELRLIKAVNGGDVVLNLFGDIKQHVEDSKGIDSWKEVSDIATFNIYNMNQNYRNARQITEYCNRRFGIDMQPINLDGDGVHVLDNEQSYKEKLIEIFRTVKNTGLSCIIVKDKAEADVVVKIAGHHADIIHNMTDGAYEIDQNKWNLMTAAQSKGLEFNTVFAISGRMSENEKYITFTRALNELFVYDKPIETVPGDSNVAIEASASKDETTMRKARKKREKQVINWNE